MRSGNNLTSATCSVSQRNGVGTDDFMQQNEVLFKEKRMLHLRNEMISLFLVDIMLVFLESLVW